MAFVVVLQGVEKVTLVVIAQSAEAAVDKAIVRTNLPLSSVLAVVPY